ncbi:MULTISPECIES: 16S rRNA (cytidine(1402)-2'-O)-methyltransferase [Brachybacterium]|uniref:16S rRNA (cytidine(1402)-2'-O)-methyltransferase n=1 Tax=Brachybacterium TaxID=43668 RepID=UPI000BB81D08|nr:MULTISPECIES: 16S rRNA (cytidine(1402)-2'-O)-methyltransferase [Brachybacterium]PCC31579.1 16S rRNA (cytidine(1402)-2'-O)-methyltransferase [Brachybacterium alimentarium]RCS67215.1 16S rRNA (cytidine(1402)-2'-O)-methyltransferase [Brachybacterium sp. JB7]RCS76263.1 16S rRNA (cytidine(1402)-2'-O)-methyltransferase [Brachybacterium alimentarium]RCS76476.1 16S rRNA (cytidine(1402)-2'-O)-methyltransferase [Brachybacterium alimentarium]RCS85581.1 16S rRNA (cytidine(1402)-2'-O)-methyltransferase 
MLEPGVLTLAATPIGNPLDASVRLMRALEQADLIAAEDTRRLARLVGALEVETTGRILSYHEHNEAERTSVLLDALAAGDRVLIVTDAGMPVVSDPGFRAVRAAADAGVRVTVIPGPSAVLTALAASGIAPDRFTFEGFPPRREGRRTSALEPLAAEQRTMVFFESPRRTAATLASMAEAFGPQRPAALARELTKTYEEIVRGTLGELAERARETEVLGEVVIVVSGAEPVAASAEDLVEQVLARVAAGERLKDVTKDVAKAHDGISASELYDLALSRKR